MKTLQMDDSWDIDITDNTFSIIKGNDKTLQDIEMVVKTVKGENIFYEQMGIPWLQIMQNPTENNVRNAIISALNQSPLNVALEEINIDNDYENRVMDITVKFRLQD